MERSGVEWSGVEWKKAGTRKNLNYWVGVKGNGEEWSGVEEGRNKKKTELLGRSKREWRRVQWSGQPRLREKN